MAETSGVENGKATPVSRAAAFYEKSNKNFDRRDHAMHFFQSMFDSANRRYYFYWAVIFALASTAIALYVAAEGLLSRLRSDLSIDMVSFALATIVFARTTVKGTGRALEGADALDPFSILGISTFHLGAKSLGLPSSFRVRKMLAALPFSLIVVLMAWNLVHASPSIFTKALLWFILVAFTLATLWHLGQAVLPSRAYAALFGIVMSNPVASHLNHMPSMDLLEAVALVSDLPVRHTNGRFRGHWLSYVIWIVFPVLIFGSSGFVVGSTVALASQDSGALAGLSLDVAISNLVAALLFGGLYFLLYLLVLVSTGHRNRLLRGLLFTFFVSTDRPWQGIHTYRSAEILHAYGALPSGTAERLFQQVVAPQKELVLSAIEGSR